MYQLPCRGQSRPSGQRNTLAETPTPPCTSLNENVNSLAIQEWPVFKEQFIKSVPLMTTDYTALEKVR